MTEEESINRAPMVLERRTERTGFIKRTTYITIEMNGKIVNTTQEHFARPIDIMLTILDLMLPCRIAVRIGETTVKKWKLPFQSYIDVVGTALTEAGKKELKKGE